MFPHAAGRRPGELRKPAAGLRAERLDELALHPGSDRVEDERRLRAVAHAGEGDEPVLRNVDVEVLELVRAPGISFEIIEYLLPLPVYRSSHVSRRSAPFQRGADDAQAVWNGSPVLGPGGRPAGTPK